jgi:sugar/nucleoside kinase (ribokinase family)
MALPALKTEPQLAIGEENLNDRLDLWRQLQEWEECSDQLKANKEKAKEIARLKKQVSDAKAKVIEMLPAIGGGQVKTFRCGAFKISVQPAGEPSEIIRTPKPRVKIVIEDAE